MIYVWVAVGIFLLDFGVKRYIDSKYNRKEKHPKPGGLVYIEKYYNNGAMLNWMEQRPGLLKSLQTVFMLVVCIGFYFSLRRNGKFPAKLGLAFLTGGGSSNLFDRYTKGHVVDYLGFCIGPKWFQRIIFNVSDFFIFIGAMLTVIGHGDV